MVTTSATGLLLQGLNASADIPATMNNIALAMTNHLREISDLVVYGSNETTEVFVRVLWLWLVFPALSIILGIVLLLSAMNITKRHNLYVWKSSELALLFHGLKIPLKDDTLMYKVSEMEAIAKKIEVKLDQENKKGLSLKKKLA